MMFAVMGLLTIIIQNLLFLTCFAIMATVAATLKC